MPGVDLSRMKLTSNANLHLPICQLRNLTSLQLQENHISGPLPPELDQCTHLEHLNLGANNFSGRIVIPLQNLRYLNLSLNSFTGENIPSGLGQLRHLQVLDLAATGLTGAFPPELGELVSFSTSSCRGISSLPHCQTRCKIYKRFSTLSVQGVDFMARSRRGSVLSKTCSTWICRIMNSPG